MRILVTGRGSSGSWAVRGEQLGRAIGAEVVPRALDVSGYDVAVLVKRPTADLLARLHRAHTPIVWDVVDAFPQPIGNLWSRSECMAWLQQMMGDIKPAAVVAATSAMAADLVSFGVPVLALPHHARPAQEVNPIRTDVRVVGYEGSVEHLGGWRQRLEIECARRGWRFVINPAQLAELDIVVAMRETTGYAPRQWKSNVKLANAMGSGTPVVCNREAGYRETQSGAERWVDTLPELRASLDELAPVERRRALQTMLLAATPTLDAVAAIYSAWLKGLLCKTAPRS